MALTLLLFGLLTDTFVAALVGLIGARRRIGFGWAFFISILFTPLAGFIVCLLSEPLQPGDRNWGCLGSILAIVTISFLLLFLLALLAAAN